MRAEFNHGKYIYTVVGIDSNKSLFDSKNLNFDVTDPNKQALTKIVQNIFKQYLNSEGTQEISNDIKEIFTQLARSIIIPAITTKGFKELTKDLSKINFEPMIKYDNQNIVKILILDKELFYEGILSLIKY